MYIFWFPEEEKMWTVLLHPETDKNGKLPTPSSWTGTVQPKRERNQRGGDDVASLFLVLCISCRSCFLKFYLRIYFKRARKRGSNLQEETAFSDPSSSRLSSIMHDVANPPLPNLDRSLVDNFGDSCPGLDSAADPTECPGWPSWGHLNPTCPKTQTLCWSMLSEDCYCHNN